MYALQIWTFLSISICTIHILIEIEMFPSATSATACKSLVTSLSSRAKAWCCARAACEIRRWTYRTLGQHKKQMGFEDPNKWRFWGSRCGIDDLICNACSIVANIAKNRIEKKTLEWFRRSNSPHSEFMSFMSIAIWVSTSEFVAVAAVARGSTAKSRLNSTSKSKLGSMDVHPLKICQIIISGWWFQTLWKILSRQETPNSGGGKRRRE